MRNDLLTAQGGESKNLGEISRDLEAPPPLPFANAVPLTPAAVAISDRLLDDDLRLWDELAGVEDDFDDVAEAFSAIDARLASKLCPSQSDRLTMTIESLQDFIAGLTTLVWPLLYDPEYGDSRISAIRAQTRLSILMRDHLQLISPDDRNRLVDVLLAIYLKFIKSAGVSYA